MESKSQTWESISEQVISYYEETIFDYGFFWHTPNDLAIHYGFSDETTKSHSDRLLNENRFLADTARIKNVDYILDAGCGVGGSTIWLARNYGTRVVGIAISPSQIAKAKINSKNAGVEKLTEFYEMDYHSTDFPDATFDVIWAIESLCHSPDKPQLFQELYRILKSGGRLIVADGFQKNKAANSQDQKVFNDFIHGLAVFQTTFWDEFRDGLVATGFRNIQRLDKTNAIIPSAKKIYHLALFFSPAWKLLNILGLISKVRRDNIRAGLAQWNALKKDIWLYGVYYAEK